MGFFSKTCAKTNLPVMTEMVGIPDLSDVVALLPNGSRIVGSYDGYGRIGPISLIDDGIFEDAKFVLKRFYNGESFEELGESHNELGQGYFHDDDLLHAWLKQGGFKTYKDYVEAYNKVDDDASKDNPQDRQGLAD